MDVLGGTQCRQFLNGMNDISRWRRHALFSFVRGVSLCEWHKSRSYGEIFTKFAEYLNYGPEKVTKFCETAITVRGYDRWCIAKNGGGYKQRGVAKGLKVPCLFMITQVSIRCQKTRRLVYGVYPRIPPNTPLVTIRVSAPAARQ